MRLVLEKSLNSTCLACMNPIQSIALGQKIARPEANMFYIDLYRENLQKSSYLKPEGPGLWYLVHIASPSGPLPSLLKL